MVLKVQRVHKATLVPQDNLDLMVLQDSKDTQAPQGPLESLENLEDQDLWDQLVLLVHQDLLDLKGTLVFLAHQGRLV